MFGCVCVVASLSGILTMKYVCEPKKPSIELCCADEGDEGAEGRNMSDIVWWLQSNKPWKAYYRITSIAQPVIFVTKSDSISHFFHHLSVLSRCENTSSTQTTFIKHIIYMYLCTCLQPLLKLVNANTRKYMAFTIASLERKCLPTHKTTNHSMACWQRQKISRRVFHVMQSNTRNIPALSSHDIIHTLSAQVTQLQPLQMHKNTDDEKISYSLVCGRHILNVTIIERASATSTSAVAIQNWYINL